MDLIKIEIAEIDRQLEHIYTLCKNKKNGKKLTLLKRRREDLIFRLQMDTLEQENDDEADVDDDDDDDVPLENVPPASENVLFCDADVDMIQAIAKSSERIKRLNKRCKFRLT